MSEQQKKHVAMLLNRWDLQIGTADSKANLAKQLD